jgi:exonuclease VII small subunit
MLKPKMHFEQVPLETVRKILERPIEQEKAAVLRLAGGEKKLEQNVEETVTVVR